jgi:hypothetical protein
MKSILPILACLAAMSWVSGAQAQAPQGDSASNRVQQTAAPDASSLSGEALVERVVAATAGETSIAAKLRHRVELGGRAFIGTGIYLQQGRGAERTFRLELELRTALNATRILQVCDGNHLWIFEEFDGNKNLTVVDMARLYRARPKSKGAAPPHMALLALAGLPKLLVRLKETFVFDSVVESRLDDLRVWSIEGKWRPDRLVQLLPEQKEAIESGAAVNLSPLPANLPHRVVLHVGCDDLFPYRIEYWRTKADEEDENAVGRPTLMAVMELYEVQHGARVDPGQFVFHAGDVTAIDRTKEYLDRLGLEDPPREEATRRLRSPL